MKTLEWKKSYSVGVQSLNDQHKVLIGRLIRSINYSIVPIIKIRLGRCCLNWSSTRRFILNPKKTCLQNISIMLLKNHALEHRLYENKVSEFKARFDSADNKVTLDMLEFLADWLTGHILGSDQEYRRYLNNCGVF